MMYVIQNIIISELCLLLISYFVYICEIVLRVMNMVLIIGVLHNNIINNNNN
jgi:type IV secretory pathway TrbL component